VRWNLKSERRARGSECTRLSRVIGSVLWRSSPKDPGVKCTNQGESRNRNEDRIGKARKNGGFVERNRKTQCRERENQRGERQNQSAAIALSQLSVHGDSNATENQSQGRGRNDQARDNKAERRGRSVRCEHDFHAATQPSDCAQLLEFFSIMFYRCVVRIHPFKVAFPLGVALSFKQHLTAWALLAVKLLQDGF
jgi:hypothetical protein